MRQDRDRQHRIGKYYIVNDTYHPRRTRVNSKPGDAPDGLRLDEFLCYAVYSAGRALDRFYRPLLDAIGLTYPQYLAMVALWEGEEHTVGSMARRLSLESHTVTPLLKRLEAMELIRRTRDATDERVVRISLTRKGRSLRARAAGIPACLRSAIGTSDDEISRLHESLLLLRDRVDEERAPKAD